MAQVPDAAVVGNPRFFHVMGCSLMANEDFRQRVFRAVEIFADRGARITFDPNIRFELLQDRGIEEIVGPVLRRCSILFPGERELAILSGKDDVEEGARVLFKRFPLELVVLKRGSRGCSIISREKKLDVPAFRVWEVDPTGAGDCFDAGFLCGQLEGKDLEKSARIAAAVGAINAQVFGPMEGRISPHAVSTMMGRR